MAPRWTPPAHGLPPATLPPRRPARWKRAVFLTATTAGLSVVGLISYVGASYWRVCGTPCLDLHRLTAEEPAAASVVLDRHGVELARFFFEDRRPLRLEEMPRMLRYAVLATEDARFYDHHGVDYVRVGGAMLRNLVSRRTAQGFSTITMQLARTTYPELLPVTEKTLRRKLAEVRVSREIEQTLTKSQILERYLNTVYLGQGAYGVEAASRRYFGKPVTALSLSEMAILAGLPRAPSRDNPVVNPTRAMARRNVVLQRMLDEHLISPAAEDSARHEPLRLAPWADRDTTNDAPTAPDSVALTADGARRSPSGTLAPFFVEALRQQLATRFGKGLYRDGLRIATTLDARIQTVTERALLDQLQRIERGELGPAGKPTPGQPPLEGAALVLDGASGDILALVGGRDFEARRFNRVTQALRQPGSAFKVITLAAALEQGWTASRLLSDDPLDITMSDGTTWSPDNFDDSHSGGMVPLSTVIAQSRNRAATRLALAVSLDSVISMGQRLGLTTPLPHVPSLALGVGSVRLLEMTAAYTPLTRGDGDRSVPRWVSSVTNRRGDTLLSVALQHVPALHPHTAHQWRDILAGVVDQGTGGPARRAGYYGPAAGKTGTTSHATDLWFIGATPSLVAGVWVGYDTPREVLPGSNGTGGRVSAPIWGRIMKTLGDSLTGTRWPDEVVPAADSTSADSSDRTPVTRPDTGRLCLERVPDSASVSSVGDPVRRSRFVPCPATKNSGGASPAARVDSATGRPPTSPGAPSARR